MDEGEIFLDDRIERDDRRLDVVAVEQVPVAAHVPARVHQLLHLVEQTLVLCRKFLPEEILSHFLIRKLFKQLILHNIFRIHLSISRATLRKMTQTLN